MTDTRFTPGPLKVANAYGHEPEPVYVDVIQVDGRYRGSVAQCHDAEHIGGVTREEMFANAHLIAAAPELYGELQKQSSFHWEKYSHHVDLFCDDGAAYHKRRAESIDALLAKARGES